MAEYQFSKLGNNVINLYIVVQEPLEKLRNTLNCKILKIVCRQDTKTFMTLQNSNIF